MSRSIRKSRQALVDLADIADYLWQGTGEATSDRFLQAAEQAITDLAGMPGMGAPWESPHTKLTGLRAWPVPGFRKWLIFYRDLGHELEILRVLHGARDLFTADITDIEDRTRRHGGGRIG